MFKILAKIFDPKKLGNSIISGIDKSILTKEESVDYMKEMLKLYEPYKLAQRILAIMFSGCFLFVHLLTALAHFIYVLRDLDTIKIINFRGKP